MHAVADIFRRAADANRDDSRRQGNTVRLTEPGEMIVAGDIHGLRDHLSRIIAFANLPANPQRILVLQELIHGPIDEKTGKDRSVELLLRAARLKLAHPQQVLFILGNHDLGQITDKEISKGGRSMCRQFADDVVASFANDGPVVLEAVLDFLASQPLAVRCPNGVLIAHSAPSPDRLGQSGADILDRDSRQDDLLRGGAVYDWTWGRNQNAEQLTDLAGKLGVGFLLLAHRHVEGGYERIGPNAAAIATDDPRGCVAVFNTGRPFTGDDFLDAVRPLYDLSRTAG
ncbi:MAG: metallophosphoesterase [Planctomycetota bacterium]